MTTSMPWTSPIRAFKLLWNSCRTRALMWLHCSGRTGNGKHKSSATTRPAGLFRCGHTQRLQRPLDVCVARPESQGPGEMGDGFIATAAAGQHTTQAIVRLGVIGRQAQGLGVLPDRLVVSAHP